MKPLKNKYCCFGEIENSIYVNFYQSKMIPITNWQDTLITDQIKFTLIKTLI